MNFYTIILNLNFDRSYYVNMEAYLKSSTRWAHPFPNIWLIRTYRNAPEIRTGIKERIQSIDTVLVLRITEGEWASFNLDTKFTNWLKE